MDPRERVLALASQEVGYKEKKSLKDLDSKTANAGSANITKYSAHIDALRPGVNVYNGRKQRVAWCDVFFDWLFIFLFGADLGRRMLCQPLNSCGAGCRYSRGYYSQAGRLHTVPQPGDQVFFWPTVRINPKAVQHTGLVEYFDGVYLGTIEGNASNGVTRRRYKITDKKLAGFGRPRWDLAGVVPEPPAEPPVVEPALPVLNVGNRGADVARAQQLLIRSGCTLPRYGIDGIFGKETKAAVLAFQKQRKLPTSGSIDGATWAALQTDSGRA